MKIIIVDQKQGQTRSLAVKGWVRVALTICLLGLPLILGYFGYQFSSVRNAELYNDKAAQAWVDRLDRQGEEIGQVRQEAMSQLQALTRRVATLQARLLRLDALGERLTAAADLEDGEFDFTRPPALGGPAVFPAGGQVAGSAGIAATIDELARQIEDRRQQLDILDNLLTGRQNRAEASLAGWPVSKGWISSGFGERVDPFTGNPAWHEGLDFATGREGVEVKSLASGVVTHAGERQGYGLLVEVNHGNGYETLYAHSQQLKVKPGDIVKKGQVIALSGNSGRSTGPHVHFEVHKNGRVVDPASYVSRTRR